MAEYKFANHPNTVLVRDWCNDNYGRGSALSELMFPNNQHPKVGLGKYKCGEQFLDDNMLSTAKEFMAQIEYEEKCGIRKVRGKNQRELKLETNKNENYAEIEATLEYQEYRDFHEKYCIYSDIFLSKLGLELPTVANPSNLMSAKFRQKINKAKKLVMELKLEPSTGHKIKRKVRGKNQRIKQIKEAGETLNTFKKRIFETPEMEFRNIVNEINEDEKLSKLVPVILMMNFSQEKDFDIVDDIYKKFTDSNNMFSMIKLINIKKSHTKALEMISDGWLVS